MQHKLIPARPQLHLLSVVRNCIQITMNTSLDTFGTIPAGLYCSTSNSLLMASVFLKKCRRIVVLKLTWDAQHATKELLYWRLNR